MGVAPCWACLMGFAWLGRSSEPRANPPTHTQGSGRVKWHTSPRGGSRGFPDQLAVALGPRMVTIHVHNVSSWQIGLQGHKSASANKRNLLCSKSGPRVFSTSVEETGIRGRHSSAALIILESLVRPSLRFNCRCKLQSGEECFESLWGYLSSNRPRCSLCLIVKRQVCR